jgi:polysaccharide export outer membrane protein
MLRSMGSRLILIVILGVFCQLAAVAQNAALPRDAEVSKPDPAPSTTTAHAGKVPVAPEYQVGESDMLQISVWKEPELSKSVVVRPDGMISLPLIGEVKVIGMTSAQIQEVVTSKLKAYLLNPRVTVEITEIKSRRVFITGEIVRPGLYPLAGPTTVLQLIAQAGGFTPFAKRKSIVILRQENGRQLKYPFNYPDVLRGRAPDQNIALAPGDTVVVP